MASRASSAAARALANQGADAYDAGDYQKAADLFHRAYGLMSVPSLSVFEARALEKLGLLVEAFEAYQRTARARVDQESPLPFRRAVQEAAEAIVKLGPRIPSLTIVIADPGKDDPKLEVKMNGKPVERLLLGVEYPVNPGQHELVATTSSGARARPSAVAWSRSAGS